MEKYLLAHTHNAVVDPEAHRVVDTQKREHTYTYDDTCTPVVLRGREAGSPPDAAVAPERSTPKKEGAEPMAAAAAGACKKMRVRESPLRSLGHAKGLSRCGRAQKSEGA
eukprot:1024580-Pelagomonas_calceolata.AAC.2